MATLRQIEANRRNALKSTGPRSAEGKASSRMNAIKTGIDAQSQIIRGENAEALQALADEYHDRFQPATPEQRFLVDELVNAEWLLRRLRKVEAEFWEHRMKRAWKLDKRCPLGQAYAGGVNEFTRLQRRIDSTQRHYRRSLEDLRRLQTETSVGQASRPVTPETPQHEHPTPQPLTPEIGFVPPTLPRSESDPQPAHPEPQPQ